MAEKSEMPYLDLYSEPGYSDIPELKQFSRLLTKIKECIDMDCVTQPTIAEATATSVEMNDKRSRKFGYFDSRICASKLTRLNRGQTLKDNGLTQAQWMQGVQSALMTHCLHLQSRVSAFKGEAFYTIGPCGEECMAPVGLVLDQHDSMALHYRHLSTQLARILKHRTLGDSTQGLTFALSHFGIFVFFVSFFFVFRV